ncbi:MAG: hypothetical protein KAW17_09565 [Candidatus Eisenbacteria sp.]|nr:hypothetical protein [Candidatus Eisenbacteria bacterium]
MRNWILVAIVLGLGVLSLRVGQLAGRLDNLTVEASQITLMDTWPSLQYVYAGVDGRVVPISASADSIPTTLAEVLLDCAALSKAVYRQGIQMDDSSRKRDVQIEQRLTRRMDAFGNRVLRLDRDIEILTRCSGQTRMGTKARQ